MCTRLTIDLISSVGQLTSFLWRCASVCYTINCFFTHSFVNNNLLIAAELNRKWIHNGWTVFEHQNLTDDDCHSLIVDYIYTFMTINKINCSAKTVRSKYHILGVELRSQFSVSSESRKTNVFAEMSNCSHWPKTLKKGLRGFGTRATLMSIPASMTLI